MSSMNYVVHQLQELGLAAEVKGETVYCEDIDLDFDRSHDGVRGISRWLVETREEYAEVIRELHEDPNLEEPEEEPVTDAQTEKAQDEAESYSEDVPCHTQAGDHGEEIKPHFFGSPLDEARQWSDALQPPKEVAQATEVDDQDRGGVPNPEDYKRVAAAVVVLMKGQRFVAPDGWKIRESRPSGKVLHYGSIYQTRKTKNEARGAAFSLVRDL